MHALETRFNPVKRSMAPSRITANGRPARSRASAVNQFQLFQLPQSSLIARIGLHLACLFPRGKKGKDCICHVNLIAVGCIAWLDVSKRSRRIWVANEQNGE